METETTGDDDLLRETTGAKTAGGGVPDDDQPSSDEPDQPPKRAGDMASKLTSDTGATTTHTDDHKIAQLTAANKAKEATLNKELMACRQRTVTMQTDVSIQLVTAAGLGVHICVGVSFSTITSVDLCRWRAKSNTLRCSTVAWESCLLCEPIPVVHHIVDRTERST